MYPSVVPDYGVHAEISITLAGFTGLVGVLASRGESKLTELQALHIANLLMSTIFVVILSFVPNWLLSLPSGKAVMWIWSIRILLLFHLAAWAIFGYFARPGGVALSRFPLLDKSIVIVFAPFGIGLVVAEFLIITGIYTSFAAFVYESVLLLFIAAAMCNFLILLLRPGK